MKKIININLSGRVIPIEDSAYEKLQAYIESLRRYFIHEEGRDEIINDIESRIAELMNEKNCPMALVAPTAMTTEARTNDLVIVNSLCGQGRTAYSRAACRKPIHKTHKIVYVQGRR